MSITLRDAQYASWKNFRMINDKLNPEAGKRWTPSAMMIDLLSKAEKLASIIKSLEDSAPCSEQETKQTIASELSDLLYTVFVLAENYRVELEDVFMQTVNDYVLKFIK